MGNERRFARSFGSDQCLLHNMFSHIFFLYHWERLCVFNGGAHIIYQTNHIYMLFFRFVIRYVCLLWAMNIEYGEHIYAMSSIGMGISSIWSPSWRIHTQSAQTHSHRSVWHTIHVNCITAAINVRIKNHICWLSLHYPLISASRLQICED